MKVPITTMTKYVNAIISLKDYCVDDIRSCIFNDLITYCNSACEIYAFALHDKDLLEDHTHKINHIHLCMVMNTSKKRLSTICNELSGSIGVSSLAISIEKMNDVNGSIQYLIHKNDINKYQYCVSDIVSNLNEEELLLYLDSSSGSLSINSLLTIIDDSNYNRVEIMKRIGLGYYHLYRNVINDIIKELRGY